MKVFMNGSRFQPATAFVPPLNGLVDCSWDRSPSTAAGLELLFWSGSQPVLAWVEIKRYLLLNTNERRDC